MAEGQSVKRSFADYAYILFCGMCMGAADIVPGISGGTIAFIMGFYSDLLLSIKSLRVKNFIRNPAVKFLGCLLSGIAFSLILLAPLFDQILNHEASRAYLYSGFLGLILASIVLCFKQIEKWYASTFFSLLLGSVLAFVLTSVNLTPLSNEQLYDVPVAFVTEQTITNYDAKTKTILNVPKTTVEAMLAKGVITKETVLFNQQKQEIMPAGNLSNKAKSFISLDLWLVFCGSIAVSALLLPGISGSYLLTILGCYSVAIGALADFIESAKILKFDADAFIVLSSLSIGIGLGAVMFSRVVLWLLNNYRSITISLMTGFMMGALQTVWPFWTYSYFLNPLKLNKGILLTPDFPILPALSPSLLVSLLLTISGFALVFLVEYLANLKTRKITA